MTHPFNTVQPITVWSANVNVFVPHNAMWSLGACSAKLYFFLETSLYLKDKYPTFTPLQFYLKFKVVNIAALNGSGWFFFSKVWFFYRLQTAYQ